MNRPAIRGASSITGSGGGAPAWASIIPSMAMGEGDKGLAARSLSPRLYRRIGMVLRRDKVPDAALRAVIKALNGIAGS